VLLASALLKFLGNITLLLLESLASHKLRIALPLLLYLLIGLFLSFFVLLLPMLPVNPLSLEGRAPSFNHVDALLSQVESAVTILSR
jgi:hypothetical protein